MLNNSSLSQKGRCTKAREHSLFLRSPRNYAIERVIAIKDILRRFYEERIIPPGTSPSIIPTIIKREVDRLYLDIDFASDEQRIQIEEEDSFLISRYVVQENGEFGTRTRLSVNPMVVNCFGTDVKVIPDAVFMTSDGIEVVKYKPGAPNLSQVGSVRDKAVNTCLEIYALWQYGLKCATSSDTNVSAGYIYLQKKGKNENATVFGSLSPSNESYRMLTMKAKDAATVDSIYEEEWLEFMTGELCEDSDCMFCEFYNACHYNPVPPEPPKKTEKSLSAVSLSKAQEEAIQFKEGIARIKAGAGAGKTLVVSLRVTTLLEDGNDPSKMLFITFTNNGAEEMRQRIRLFCRDFGIPDSEVDKIRVTTFNSFGQLAIENEWPNLGYTECPSVIDSITRKQKILNAVAGVKLPGVNYKNFEGIFGNGGFDDICEKFDLMKFYRVNLYNYEQLREDVDELQWLTDTWVNVFQKYEDDLFSSNLIEYADQQRILEEILSADPYYIQNKYGIEHTIVDEYQDTSEGETEILKKIIDSPNFKSLLVVGDDSQNIFESLRRTTVKNIIDFGEIMGQDITDFELMENYRSTKAIIDVANAVNKRRSMKLNGDIIATREEGNPVEVYGFESQPTEYKYVADRIEELVLFGVKPEEIAFIAKDGNELKAMSKILTERGIQSQYLTPESVLNNSRVVAAIAAAEYLDDENNTLSGFDYLNTLSDGKLFDKTDEDIQNELDALKEKTRGALTEKSKTDVFSDMLSALDDSDEVFHQFKERIKNFHTWDDLYSYLKAFKRFGGKEKYRRKAYAGNGVILTTVHSSKGLEWNYIFISITKFSSGSKTEENRRVLFTAVTRARDLLVITGVANKSGNYFLRELFDIVGKQFEVVKDENDGEKQKRKERKEEVKGIIKASKDKYATEKKEKETESNKSN